jgi:hypothetical protein
MAVRQIHPHLHVLYLLRFERIEGGVIYPDLPRLTRLNSHPINADGYLAGSGGFALFGKGLRMRAPSLARSRRPSSIPLTRKSRSRAFQD